jgi:hypothetical protein
MTTLDIKVSLSNKILGYLRQEAANRQVTLDMVVSDVLADYFDEPTEDEILDSLRIGMQQALGADYRPAHEVLDEIDRETIDDADNR